MDDFIGVPLETQKKWLDFIQRDIEVINNLCIKFKLPAKELEKKIDGILENYERAKEKLKVYEEKD